MATGKKMFGTIGGVFTPSILTILGVIMYLRLGWVVGNAGLWGAIMIVIIAHVISITTGLSISSIATDKKVGAGGVYYVLSRSLGLPIGGAIGLTLFVGTALSIALYLVGFSESFNATIGIGTDINSIRLTGSLALLTLTIIAFISTSLAIKTQYFILAAIAISIISIFFGRTGDAGEVMSTAEAMPDVPLEAVFAIFFPAVTGFTAGIAMSGDLKDPKKSIPTGTIAAIVVGFVVYIALTVFLALKVDEGLLKSDYNILLKIAIFAPAVIAGIWGATLSSALGGILGGPRILQAMSLDKITPAIFGKEQGKTKEPRYALILAVILAECGILIGSLDVVARIVSMFYLAAYGFINISFFLESWASSDFRPSFKVSKWVGFVGFIATFGVMFRLDMLAMFLALIIIGGIYLWLARREIALGTGDIWQSVWSTGIKEGLRRLESKDDHKRNWKPNILLFSGNSEARPHLISFSQALAGRAGLVTNFDLVENKGMDVLFPKHKQSIKDELLRKHGIFGRRIEVKNVYQGIESIATTFGFSGLDPNTVLMGWARNTKDPIWFAQATQRLIDLDYNVLYLDYDRERGFGKQQQIDLWWRGISRNAELMLQIAKFVSHDADWRNARIRVLLVNDFNMDRRIIENRISKLLDEFRLQTDIKVIDNHLDRKPFYDILQAHSLRSDLVLIGIPHIIEGSETQFVQKTNDLCEVIGTTLLVKASTTFDETQLGLKQLEEDTRNERISDLELEKIIPSANSDINEHIQRFDRALESTAEDFSEQSLKVITRHYQDFVTSQERNTLAVIDQFLLGDIPLSKPELLKSIIIQSDEFRADTLPLLSEILEQGIESYLEERQAILEGADSHIPLIFTDKNGQKSSLNLQWKKALNHYNSKIFWPAGPFALRELGKVSSSVVIQCKELIKKSLERMTSGQNREMLNTQTKSEFAAIKDYARNIMSSPIHSFRQTDREICNAITSTSTVKDFNKNMSRGFFKSGGGVAKQKLAFMRKYASYWLRNQVLFHNRFETGIELKRTNLQLSDGVYHILDRVQKNPVEELSNEIEDLQKELERLDMIANTREVTTDDLREYEGAKIQLFDYVPLLRTFRKQISKATAHLPQEVEMMDSTSYNEIDSLQGIGIQTVSFSVDKIADYLIETKFIAGIQESLAHLNRDINALIGNFLNIRGLLKYHINKQGLTPNTKALQHFTEKNKKAIESLNNHLQSIQKAYTAEVSENLNATVSELEVKSIIDQADVLTQYVLRKDIRSGIGGRLKSVQSSLNEGVKKSVGFIADRKEDIQRIEFATRNQQLQNTPDIIRTYIYENSTSSDIWGMVPFYYKQLFSGKHLHSGKMIANRSYETERAEMAIKHIEEGVHGAIMITGTALSGKTFLTENIVNQHLQGNPYYIAPPTGGAMEVNDLAAALNDITGISGSIDHVMQMLDSRSVIVFNDVELWWLNTYNGDEVIRAITALIHKYGDRHYFILNSNLHSLNFLNRTTNLQEVLVTTILLRPLSREDLKTEILKRHKIGGISLKYKGSLIDEDRSDRQMEKLLSRIYTLSKGNIGFALSIWLSCIGVDEDGALYLEMPPHREFPDIQDADWKNVLLQLSLHRALTRQRFDSLYATMGSTWVDKMISEVRTSLIIANPASIEVDIKRHIRPYVEDWLMENEVL